MNRAIAWFASNSVAANLLMWFLIVAGLVSASGLHREEFPDIEPGIIDVSVAYPGGAPAEIEQSICIRLEESLDGTEGVRHLRTVAFDGACRVSIELLRSADPNVVLNDVKSRIDSIEHFPEVAEKPIVTEQVVHIPVVDLSLSGPVDERTLKQVGKRLRDELLALPELTQVELHFARPYEISIEISEEALRRHALSFDEVADAVRRSSLDVPAGRLRARDGEIRLRTTGQAYRGAEFANLIVLTDAAGTEVKLGEIARIIDGFEELDLETHVDGEPGLMIRVLRVGRQDALDIRHSVAQYIDSETGWIPAGIEVGIWLDHSEEIRERLGTLFENALLGLVLVLIVLALFLRFRLAFWVAAGLPVVFLGALTLFPWIGYSINTITVMAFILALGIVVDDAIVVGENIYRHQQRGVAGLDAAVAGTREVYVPVIFGVLTTMTAFLPLLIVGGNLAAMFSGVGIGVVSCLIFSIVESQWILPAHLARVPASGNADTSPSRELPRWQQIQSRVAAGLERFIEDSYVPFLQWVLGWRVIALAVAIGCLLLVGALLASGRVPYEFLPPVEGDHVSAIVKMPSGTSMSVARETVAEIERVARLLRRELDPGDAAGEGARPIVRHIVTAIGAQPFRQSLSVSAGSSASEGASIAEVTLALIPGSERSIGARAIAERWREGVELARIPDVETLVFSADMFTAGRPIDVQLRGADLTILERAAARVRTELGALPGVIDLQDSFSSSQREIELRLLPEARPLGLTLEDLGRQVRQAFYGEEVQRIQRGPDEVRVMVRYPLEERRSLAGLESLRVRTAEGAEVPLATVASIIPRRALAAIHRTDRMRVINIAGDVDRSITTPARVSAALDATLPGLLREFPGVSYRFEGAQQEDSEASAGLLGGFALAMLGIYALLAVPLRSYSQPLLIMSVIPFGSLGAILGHLVMGQAITFFSLVGVVALAGVVVNASLMLVHFANRLHLEALAAGGARSSTLVDAVVAAGRTRFRPILLTSLTTFVGLLPLILERSVPLQTMIPMAVSLGFGVLVSTLFTLVLVPCEILLIEDLRRGLGRWGRAAAPPPSD